MATPPDMSGDRFFVITDDDQRGSLWVVSIICCVYVLMILILRSTTRKGAYGMDDWLAVTSTVTGLIQYIMIFVTASRGLGKSYADISHSQAEFIGKSILIANIFLFVTLFLAKATVIYLCRRIFASSGRGWICDVAAAVCAMWCLASILTLSIDCSPLEQIGYRTSFCSNVVTRWSAIEVFDAITEVLMVALAIVFIWTVQTPWRRKVVIVLHFVPRLLLVVFMALHIVSLEDSRDATIRRSYYFTRSEIYLQVQVLYSVFSAAIPAVNRWLRGFDTSMGGVWTTSMTYGSGHTTSRKRTHLGSNIRMKSIKTGTNVSRRSNGNGNGTEDERPHKAPFRPDLINYSASVSGQVEADAQSGASDGSGDSQANIIRREVQWQVHHEPYHAA